jgi:hypothetical protein
MNSFGQFSVLLFDVSVEFISLEAVGGKNLGAVIDLVAL